MMSLERILEKAFPECDDHNMNRNRLYIGQPHTTHGERGKTEIKGITFRDLSDCFIRACFLSAFDQNEAGYNEANKGENGVLTENDLYSLNFNRIDIVAVRQNLCCQIERMMGIYPNIPKPNVEG